MTVSQAEGRRHFRHRHFRHRQPCHPPPRHRSPCPNSPGLNMRSQAAVSSVKEALVSMRVSRTAPSTRPLRQVTEVCPPLASRSPFWMPICLRRAPRERASSQRLPFAGSTTEVAPTGGTLSGCTLTGCTATGAICVKMLPRRSRRRFEPPAWRSCSCVAR